MVAELRPPASSSATVEGPGRRILQAWLVWLPALAIGFLGYSRRFMSDDGLIVTRSVREILAGNGPVQSPGERVETATSALWQWLVVLATMVTRADPAEVAVYLGLLLSVLGFAGAMSGTRRLLYRPDQAGPAVLPAGVLVLLALPPVWDFATSGLETGLITCWLGTAWLLLVRSHDDQSGHVTLVTSFVLGLGPLVRPDLTIVTIIFFATLMKGGNRWVGWQLFLKSAGVAAALPIVYEIFRMGYYGLLVPMPALTKESNSSDWTRGWHYLADFVLPFRLWIVGPLMFALIVLIERTFKNRKRLLVITPVAAGGLSALYVVRVGGDWMQARMLLPALFLVTLPVLAVPITRATGALFALIVGWTVAGASLLHPPTLAPGRPDTDVRVLAQQLTGTSHPVTSADFMPAIVEYAKTAHAIEGKPEILLFGSVYGDTRLYTIPLVSDSSRPVFVAGFLGATGGVVPLDDPLIDQLSLSYPLGAHLELQRLVWAGHEKLISNAWILADYAAPGQVPAGLQAPDVTPALVATARHALTCGQLAELQQSTRQPLTIGRFVKNVVGAGRRTQLRVPRDPRAAEHLFCSR